GPFIWYGHRRQSRRPNHCGPLCYWSLTRAEATSTGSSIPPPNWTTTPALPLCNRPEVGKVTRAVAVQVSSQVMVVPGAAAAVTNCVCFMIWLTCTNSSVATTVGSHTKVPVIVAPLLPARSVPVGLIVLVQERDWPRPRACQDPPPPPPQIWPSA